ncbi:MAG TPA: hypothetical protein VHG93_18800 [Longimicrobium sp.]|nr:hypothetical protein [Longimicrobium sp.]
MRIRHHLLPLLLLPTLACSAGDGSSPGGLVLVHASDPHLLDYKRPSQVPLNEAAWDGMFASVARGEAGRSPRYLVITGDFGLEATDPRLNAAADAAQDAEPDAAGEAEPPRPAEETTQTETATAETSPADTGAAEATTAIPATTPATPAAAMDSVQRAEQRRQVLAGRVARSISESSFDSVFFVPGNNDVFLEDARPTAWREVPLFVQAVNDSLGAGKRFIDLTECYRAPAFNPASCVVRLDSPYVLIGFPSVSFKNAGVRRDEYRRYEDPDWDSAAVPFDSAMRRRMRDQDVIHRELMRKFTAAVAVATGSGRRRAIVMTHIPALDDPYAVGRTRANLDPEPIPRLTRGPLEAWNVSSAVFAGWNAAVTSPGVAGVLAGHFHDSHREVYYRPYPWSAASADLVRWRTMVTPPLSVKMQEASPIQARGYSVVWLRRGELRRRLHWFDPDAGTFQADAAAEGSGPPPAAPAATPRSIRPSAGLARASVLALAFLGALFAALLWRAEGGSLPGNILRALLMGGLAVLAAAVLQNASDAPEDEAVAYTVFWFTVLFVVLLLLHAALQGRMAARRDQARPTPQGPRGITQLTGAHGFLTGGPSPAEEELEDVRKELDTVKKELARVRADAARPTEPPPEPTPPNPAPPPPP